MSTIDQMIEKYQKATVVGQYVTNNKMPLDLRFVFDLVEDIEKAVSEYAGNGAILYDGLLAFCKEDNSIYKFRLYTDDKGNATSCTHERVEYLENVSLDENENILIFTNSLGDETKIELPKGGTTSNFVSSVNGVAHDNSNNTTVNIIAPILPTDKSYYKGSLGKQYDLLYWFDDENDRESLDPVTNIKPPRWASLWDLTRPAVSDENGVTGCAQKIYHDDGEL